MCRCGVWFVLMVYAVGGRWRVGEGTSRKGKDGERKWDGVRGVSAGRVACTVWLTLMYGVGCWRRVRARTSRKGKYGERKWGTVEGNGGMLRNFC